jgi:pyruvate dehydrogenase E2 component (dihydrolipoyllysine-residue acetyltransferase)
MSEGTTTVVVPMPHMGVSVEEGTVVEWLVELGDSVTAEQPICAIATDKVDTEVLAPTEGVLAKILVQVDEDVAVGAPLAELAVGPGGAAVPGGGGALDADSADATPRGGGGALGADSADAARRGTAASSEDADGASRSVSGESTPTALPRAGASDPGLKERAAAGRDEFGRFDPVRAARALLSSVPRPSSPGGGQPASPIARRMAREHGIALGSIDGSGRGGRIRKSDVEAAISGEARSATPAPGETSATPPPPSPADRSAGELPAGYEDVPHEIVKTGRVRRVIAEHMVRSRQTAAHMTTEVDVDLSALVAVRAEINEARLGEGGAKLSYLPFIARAACDALAEHPALNASFLGERTVLWKAVNLGVAVDTAEGLLVPVVRGCERLSAAEIGSAIADLAERARGRKLAPDELAGGTFTLSNPGSVGAVSAPAIINQPQVAVLGVPAIQRRAWVVAAESGEESVEIRPILRLAVTFDHRALDGADATRFAVAVKNRLEVWSGDAYE